MWISSLRGLLPCEVLHKKKVPVPEGTTSKPHQPLSVHKPLLFAESKVSRATNTSAVSWEEVAANVSKAWARYGVAKKPSS